MAGAVRKILVTGAGGLIGWHAAARLHAYNCGARFKGEDAPYDLVALDRDGFNDDAKLAAALDGADAVLHFAGVNRGTDEEVAAGNPAIAQRLADAVTASGGKPVIVYANSTHADGDSLYGKSKAEAAGILGEAAPLANLVLPHIFGETARPDYNNVTATLIDRLWKGEAPQINDGAVVHLLHAGEAAQIAIGASQDASSRTIRSDARTISVADLREKLQSFHASYTANIFPDFSDPFDLALFNTYRTGGFPEQYPLAMDVRSDARGDLFETAKSRGSGQSFVSTTLPGQRRGDHFHFSLVERFLVVSGKAVIRVRKLLSDDIVEFEVSGDHPVAIDMPPLHTHHIENVGDEPVVTYFWAHRLFDPANPDTYADPVLKEPQP
ncbi:NAD-dependent epimerase/dehydratase family protein [Sphingomicrobium sediminis]|uniref:NAD-dependent epimerase/dehydratase family protein n=1 Tax=Sphingomicrobium sediminis TaxID=2950949 RepID=A0A9X2EEV2_9SPHN|nr:NAD-dependent epimerase/dehydratase family protein [Sphingomicrobium sediminis]MCM8556638.1 NAD-dependent epimerase/dehydratase family protein [Sphingomicrobium sediminis]